MDWSPSLDPRGPTSRHSLVSYCYKPKRLHGYSVQLSPSSFLSPFYDRKESTESSLYCSFAAKKSESRQEEATNKTKKTKNLWDPLRLNGIKRSNIFTEIPDNLKRKSIVLFREAIKWLSPFVLNKKTVCCRLLNSKRSKVCNSNVCRSPLNFWVWTSEVPTKNIIINHHSS